jgi:hypothetical protein
MKAFFQSLAGALFGAVVGFCALTLAAPTTLPLPGIPGPTLGDPISNLYSLAAAYQALNGLGAGDVTTISQTSGQANCTNIGPNSISGLHRLKTSAGTGYICLPTATAGQLKLFGNATGQTIDIYSSATSYTSGTADTINGTAGSTAYTGLISGKSAFCFAPVNGVWFCGSIS